MTYLSDSQLKAQLDDYIFQNVSRLVTAARVNEFLTNVLDSKPNLNSPFLGLCNFDASRSYLAINGICVVYDGVVWQCTTDHTGLWNPAHFTQISETIENVQDTVAAMMVNSATITWTYDDTDGTLTATATSENLGSDDLTSSDAIRKFHLHGNASTDKFIFDDGTNELVTILGDGSVGFGQSNPTSLLHLKTGTNAVALTIERNNTQNIVVKLLNSVGDAVYYGMTPTGVSNGFAIGSSTNLGTNPYFLVESSGGRLIHNLSSSVISDSHLFNNTVSLYTDGTYLKARYKNNSGTASDLILGSNMYNASDTISDALRTVSLHGSAGTDLLKFKGGSNYLLGLEGDGKIAILTDTYTSQVNIGDASNFKTGSMYINGTTGWTFYSDYSGSSRRTIDFGGLNLGRTLGWYNTNAGELSGYVDSNTGGLTLGSANTFTPLSFYNGGGIVGKFANGGQGTALNMFDRNFSSSNPVIYLDSSTGADCFIIRRKFGFGTTTPGATVDIKGDDTSAGTITALFSNSGNVVSLKVLNDSRVIQNLASSVITDSYLMNNSVNFYTDGTSLKARYKNNSGTASDLTIGSATVTTSLFEPFGDINNFVTAWSESDQEYFFRFKCPHDMTITKLWTWTNNVGSGDTVRMNICNSGGTVIQGGTFTPAAVGWEAATITSTALTGGTEYWIGIKCETGSWNGLYVTTAMSNAAMAVGGFNSGALGNKAGSATGNRVYVAVGN